MAALPSGGFDAHFVEPLNDQWTCPICQFAAREPTLTKCGHQFCQECLRPLIRDGNVTCPVCSEELKESDTFLNNMTKRQILSLKILCDKREEGCSWQGELRQLDEHNQECDYVVKACSNDCGELVMRKDMDDHKQNTCSRRIVGCCYCDTQLEHGQLCDHYVVCADCPHQSATQDAVKELVVDISRKGVCPTSPLQCDSASSGCHFLWNREQQQEHLDNNTGNHVTLAMNSLSDRLVGVEKKLAETDFKLAEATEKQAETDSKLAEEEEEHRETKAQLASTRTDYRRLVDTLDVVLRSSRTYTKLMTDGWKESLESVEFLTALLDTNTQTSFEGNGTFVYLWKIDSSGMTSPFETILTHVMTRKHSRLSTPFHIGYSGLQLQLKFRAIARNGDYSFIARVYFLNSPLPQSKYLVSLVLYDRHNHRSKIQTEIDFSLLSAQAQSYPFRGRGRFGKVDLEFPCTVCFVLRNGLLMAFQVESQRD
ncbi:TNF receptor-associated factor 6-like [Corticium candelabrum]|uniref:TNF receptor-associated factor 6-like n=1 Tax=Corticium candelabrum TaxID=121492 RepID=UPI002E274F7B|nr:TNF receptor-associated factor 6-like [Corticium candelabrum]